VAVAGAACLSKRGYSWLQQVGLVADMFDYWQMTLSYSSALKHELVVLEVAGITTEHSAVVVL